ncbi:DUF3900 domain-containing protein [Alkalicoccus daliensis]|uniref:DUF3898 domain-containing protein n=1 Tax=Alkalicoccus daliensis TaxID=745820 RepID=A0A1G9ZI71_9BACI|nr:DUF3900 domain-containing protein [Alkalicoccus daliensis]SDN21172.1 protein of unknown function [Alkalicoccus daliensis]
MEMNMNFIAFYAIQDAEGSGKQAVLQTIMGNEDYENSAIETFLHEEFKKMLVRKADRHPSTPKAATKVGQFMVEPGFELASNPNYAMLERVRQAKQTEDFTEEANKVIDAYIHTSANRGGIMLVVQVSLPEYSSQPFVLITKCDFEDHIVTLGDEKSLLRQVNRAISTKGMKAIQFPHMPHEGMVEPWEIKIHQASHAHYFEDFLPYVEYPKTKNEVAALEVVQSAQEFVLSEFEEDSEERIAEEEVLEAWANTEERTLQGRWEEDKVKEVSQPILERNPEVKLRLKLDHMKIDALLEDFGEQLQIARIGERYVVLLEGEYFSFDKEASPVEFLQPDSLDNIVSRMKSKYE